MKSQSKIAAIANMLKSRSIFHRLSLASILMMGSSHFASAQTTYTYSPTSAATDVWASGTNWSATPVSSIDSTLVFGPTSPTRFGAAILTNTNTNNIGTFQLNALTLQGQGAATTLFPVVITIAGSPLDFNTSTAALAPVVNLTAANGTGTSTVTYNVNTNLSLTAGTTFQGAGNATFNFGGIISGAGSLTKTGASSMTLSGANTYSGATALNGGTVRISAANNLGNASGTNTISFNGGTLLSTANTYSLGTNRAVTLNGAGTIDVTAGTLTVDGTVTNGANLLTVQGAGNTIISGAIGSGAGGVTKAGAGTLTLTGSNGYTGLTTLNAGNLNVGSANALAGGGGIRFTGGTLQYSAANTTDYNTRITTNASAVKFDVNGQAVTFNNALDATNTGGFTLVGTGGGSLTLNVANAYTGTTTITSGNLILATAGTISSGALNINGGTLTASGTARSFANATTLTNNSTIGAGQDITFGSGGTFTNSGGNRTLTVSNTTTTLAGPVYTSENSTSSRTLTFAGAGAANVTGAISNSSAGVGTNAGIVAYTGTGTLTLSGANSYTGGFTMNGSGGTLALDNANALGGNGGAALGTLTWTAGNIQALNSARTVGNAVSITGGTIGVTGSQDLTFSQVLNMASSSTITVNNSGVTNFNGGMNLASSVPTGNRNNIITGSGTVNLGNVVEGFTGATPSNTLTYSGTGILNLNGTSTATGNFAITNAGKVVLGNATALGFGGAQTLTLTAGQATNNTGAGVGNTQVGATSTLDLGGQTVNEPIVLQGGSLLNNSGTAATVNNGVAGIGLLVGGSSGAGFTAGSTVSFTGGGGTGASATINSIGYAAGSFNIAAAGTGYVVGNTFNIAGAGSTGAQIRVTAVDGGGGITAYTVGPGTTSVTGAATAVTAATVSGTGASFGINGTPIYQVSSLTMNSAGSGYTSAPTISATGGTFSTTAPVLSQVQLTANSSIGGTGDMTVAAVISSFGGANGLTKVGAGKVITTGANVYTGATVETAGTLLINGSHTGGSAYSINGGTFGGSGTITNVINTGITIASGAKLAPGSDANTIGTLTAAVSGTGTVDISAAVGGANTGALVFDLGATGDKFVLTTGALNIGLGQLEFSDFSFNALTGLAAGVYTIFDTNVAILGTLGSSLTGSINGSYDGTISMSGGVGSNNDIILTVVAVPEPSTYALLTGGIGFLVVLRRRMKKIG